MVHGPCGIRVRMALEASLGVVGKPGNTLMQLRDARIGGLCGMTGCTFELAGIRAVGAMAIIATDSIVGRPGTDGEEIMGNRAGRLAVGMAIQARSGDP